MTEKSTNQLRKFTNLFINSLWKFLAFSLIFLAISIASIRLFSSEFSRFKPDIETFLSEQLERKVSIHSISLDWPAQGPVIQLKQLELAQDNSKAMSSLIIANGFVAINLWKSLYYFDWITDEINFQGIQTTLNPALKASNSSLKDTQKKANTLNDWLLRQATIEIYDSFLLLSADKNQRFSYALPVLTFHGGNEKQQLKASVITASGSEITLRIEKNNTINEQKTELDLYLYGNNITLEEFPEEVFYPDLPQLKGFLNLELWSSWKNNKLEHLVTKTSAEKITIGDSSSKISISPLTLLWKRFDSDSWAFTTSKILITMDEEHLEPFQLEGDGNSTTENKPEKWSFKGLNIPIPLLTSLSKNYLPLGFQEWVAHANPTGEIDDFSAQLELDSLLDGNDPKFKLEFSVNHFNASQWQKFPGLENIDAHFAINENSSTFKIQSENGELNLAPLFRYPIQFSTLETEIKLALNEDITYLTWKNLKFNSSELNVQSTGKLEFFRDGDGYMEIIAKLNDGDTSFTPWFLPAKVMSKTLTKYLDESIHEGELTNAIAIIRGPFSAFPFENEDGVFDISANIKNVHFEYLPDWPAIKNLSANLRFIGKQVLITAQKGNVSGLNLNSTTAEIKTLEDDKRHLLLDINAAGEVAKAMELLALSPLHSIPKSLVSLEFGGELKTHIDIDVLLKSTQKPEVNGNVEFEESSITLKSPTIPFKKVTGGLKFNENGLIDINLNGKLWQEQFNASLKDQSSDEQMIIEGTLNSKIGSLGLTSLSGVDASRLSKGAADISGVLAFKSNKQSKSSQILLDFSSTLDGLELDIPGVITKAHNSLSPFKLNIDIKDEITTINSSITNKMSLITRKENKKWRGSFYVGDDLEHTPFILPEEDIWQWKLELGNINVSEWINITKNIYPQNSNVSHSIPVHIEATTTNLSALGFNFDKAYIELDYLDSLSLSIKSEYIDASLSKSNISYEPLQINFKSLNLIPEIDTEFNTETALDFNMLFEEIKPSSIPAMTISCENCNYSNQTLGTIELEIRQAGENLGFEGKWFSNDIFNTNFSGLWTDDNTKISGEMTSEDFEKLSIFWDMQTGIKESKNKTTFVFSWKGTPFDINSKTLQGKISSEFSTGHLDEVSTKGAQLFSFLSLQNLKRRLTLDFNDVFEKGFFYDKISGTFLIKDGKAHSQNVFIDGTAADVEVFGYADIVNREFNQHMIVTPKLSSSIPVLAGWAISPTTALVALVLDKLLFKPALDVVTRIDYKLSGPWDNPVLIESGKQQKEYQLEQPSDTDTDTDTDTSIEEAEQIKSIKND